MEVEFSVMVGVVVQEIHKGHHHRLLEDIRLLIVSETIGHHKGDQLLEELLAVQCLPG